MSNQISDRIQARMTELGLKQADLVKATGAGRTTVSNWVNGNTEPTGVFPAKLAKVLKVDTNWLLTGIDEKTQFENDHIADLDQTIQAQIRVLLGLPLDKPIDLSTFKKEGTQTFDEQHQNVGKPIPLGKIRQIPIISWVQAGSLTDISHDLDYEDVEPIYGDYGDNIFWLRIKGDSMEPTFKEDELILVDTDKYPNPGNYVIALADGDTTATFKKWKPCGIDENTGKEYSQLIPLNNYYPIIDSRYKPFNIRGVVIEHKRKLA